MTLSCLNLPKHFWTWLTLTYVTLTYLYGIPCLTISYICLTPLLNMLSCHFPNLPFFGLPCHTPQTLPYNLLMQSTIGVLHSSTLPYHTIYFLALLYLCLIIALTLLFPTLLSLHYLTLPLLSLHYLTLPCLTFPYLSLPGPSIIIVGSRHRCRREPYESCVWCSIRLLTSTQNRSLPRLWSASPQLLFI